MIPIKHDGYPDSELVENCCFCHQPTHYWYKRKDVAVCDKCAIDHKAEQVPPKAVWCAEDEERFAQRQQVALGAPIQNVALLMSKPGLPHARPVWVQPFSHKYRPKRGDREWWIVAWEIGPGYYMAGKVLEHYVPIKFPRR